MTEIKAFQEKLKKEIIGDRKISGQQCVVCRQYFMHDNVFTDAGWQEVAISQTCEKCFNELCESFE